ncbi:hypothetical protein [Vibrio sp. SS-MA-C1-2]|nr:hypothetical protein [Vibrio sp. SS-MA-C1-2]
MNSSTSSTFDKVGRIISGVFFVLASIVILLFIADSLMRHLS